MLKYIQQDVRAIQTQVQSQLATVGRAQARPIIDKAVHSFDRGRLPVYIAGDIRIQSTKCSVQPSPENFNLAPYGTIKTNGYWNLGIRTIRL